MLQVKQAKEAHDNILQTVVVVTENLGHHKRLVEQAIRQKEELEARLKKQDADLNASTSTMEQLERVMEVCET